jgi:hypothetical protein
MVLVERWWNSTWLPGDKVVLHLHDDGDHWTVAMMMADRYTAKPFATETLARQALARVMDDDQPWAKLSF